MGNHHFFPSSKTFYVLKKETSVFFIIFALTYEKSDNHTNDEKTWTPFHSVSLACSSLSNLTNPRPMT